MKVVFLPCLHGLRAFLTWAPARPGAVQERAAGLPGEKASTPELHRSQGDCRRFDLVKPGFDLGALGSVNALLLCFQVKPLQENNRNGAERSGVLRLRLFASFVVHLVVLVLVVLLCFVLPDPAHARASERGGAAQRLVPLTETDGPSLPQYNQICGSLPDRQQHSTP